MPETHNEHDEESAPVRETTPEELQDKDLDDVAGGAMKRPLQFQAEEEEEEPLQS